MLWHQRCGLRSATTKTPAATAMFTLGQRLRAVRSNSAAGQFLYLEGLKVFPSLASFLPASKSSLGVSLQRQTRRVLYMAARLYTRSRSPKATAVLEYRHGKRWAVPRTFVPLRRQHGLFDFEHVPALRFQTKLWLGEELDKHPAKSGVETYSLSCCTAQRRRRAPRKANSCRGCRDRGDRSLAEACEQRTELDGGLRERGKAFNGGTWLR